MGPGCQQWTQNHEGQAIGHSLNIFIAETDEEARRRAVSDFSEWILSHDGWADLGRMESPITGGDGYQSGTHRVGGLDDRDVADARRTQDAQTQRPGVRHGYFDHRAGSPENEKVVAQINAAGPDVLLLGLGMPLQEIWLRENRHRLAAFSREHGQIKTRPQLLPQHFGPVRTQTGLIIG